MLNESEDQKKRILILTTDIGFGHRSAAKAVSGALQERYGEQCITEIVNPLEHEKAPTLLRNNQGDYDKLVREMPDLYRVGYELANGPVPTALIESALTAMLFQALRDIIRHYEPHVIVSTHEFYLAPVAAVFRIRQKRCPVVTVVTDLASLHRTWFNTISDLCLVPTHEAYDLAMKCGLTPESVKITGLPINPTFATEQRSREEIRSELGWHTDLKTVLVVGSTRVTKLPETLHVLNHSGLPIQLVIVCGGDDQLYQQLNEVEWHCVTHIYNYVDNMPQMMHAADCVLGKAGGLFVTEALACGLPILLVDVIEGQETGNADFVVNNGAGELVHDPVSALETLYHWLDKDGALLAERADSACKLGRAHAAYEAAEMIAALAEQGCKIKEESASALTALTDMLSKFNISWQEDKEDSKAAVK